MVQDKRIRGTAKAGSRGDGQPTQEDLPLMRLAPGERFFRFYILSDPGIAPQQRMEHRIITKEHADGSLEMVSYNAWVSDGESEKRGVIRVSSLSKELLIEIVERVRTRSHLSAGAFREIDLSRCETVEDQLRLLAELNL